MKALPEEEQQLINQLAKRIKSLRHQQGYTNYEHFANETGISRTQYGRYETGNNMKFLTLAKVIKGMGLSWKEFFAEGFDD